jgi:hypothetical protein
MLLDPNAPNTDLRARGDLGDGGQGEGGQVRGQVCTLAEIRDYRLCAVAGGRSGISVTAQEAHGAAETDASGRFVLGLQAGSPQVVTLVLADGRRQLASAAVQLQVGGPATAVPMVTVQRMELLRAQGIQQSPSRGALLAYVVDGSGAPVRGAQAQVRAADRAFQGPFYEEGSEILVQGGRTGPSGLVAVFDLPPGKAELALTGTRQATYPVVAVAGAVTFTLLR